MGTHNYTIAKHKVTCTFEVKAMVTTTVISQKSSPEQYRSCTSDQTTHFKQIFKAVLDPRTLITLFDAFEGSRLAEVGPSGV